MLKKIWHELTKETAENRQINDQAIPVNLFGKITAMILIGLCIIIFVVGISYL